jgi:FkbM family methyltransferase
MLQLDGRRELGALSKAWYRFRFGLRGRLPLAVAIDGEPPAVRFVCTTLRELKRAATLHSKEEGTIAWLKKELRPGDVFLDIGANIGVYTLYAALRLGDAGAVTAVEPHLVNAARLMENVQANGLGDRVSVLTAAVADASGFSTFNYRDWGAGTSNSQIGSCRDSSGAIYEAAARELKSVVTVDALIAAGAIRRPDIVKIDVDGVEPQILKGMQALLTGAVRPRSLQVEVEPATLEPVEKQLAAWGYARQSRHFSKGGQRRLAAGETELAVPHNVIFAPSA